MNEEIEYLARSDTRVELLRVLAEGPKGRRDLHDRLDASRTTLSRSLDRMSEFGWIEQQSNGSPYRLTALGAHVEREFSHLLEGLEVGDRLAPLLQRASVDEFDLGPRELADARVVEATAEQPLAPVERAMEARAQSDSIREFATGAARRTRTARRGRRTGNAPRTRRERCGVGLQAEQAECLGACPRG